MRRLYSNPNNRYRTLNLRAGATSVVQLKEELAPLHEYIAEREQIEAQSKRDTAAADASAREKVVEVAEAMPAIVKQPDKRKRAYKGKKQVKTRTRRMAQHLRLTRTVHTSRPKKKMPRPGRKPKNLRLR